ncbi:hypothetical protein VFPPC_16204 [Pochonia chlamydosporia 170]|uniref:Uncharacterized protein n=1 Tax=Pochonia chlamydosporia 170 TaxID=1380566 RepID=A0A179FGF0_METCM|nr:hypothetical protein VFPPC_16204 [Pochonia chlamydosporia 170]OAQ64360.1 hypothetical protein VFPPC_16204 [Pochonia chlamydosporia 170]
MAWVSARCAGHPSPSWDPKVPNIGVLEVPWLHSGCTLAASPGRGQVVARPWPMDHVSWDDPGEINIKHHNHVPVIAANPCPMHPPSRPLCSGRSSHLHLQIHLHRVAESLLCAICNNNTPYLCGCCLVCLLLSGLVFEVRGAAQSVRPSVPGTLVCSATTVPGYIQFNSPLASDRGPVEDFWAS